MTCLSERPLLRGVFLGTLAEARWSPVLGRVQPMMVTGPSSYLVVGRPAEAEIEVKRSRFLCRVERVGTEEAAGYVSIVGGAVGEQIDREYRRAIAVDRLSREQVPHFGVTSSQPAVCQ